MYALHKNESLRSFLLPSQSLFNRSNVFVTDQTHDPLINYHGYYCQEQNKNNVRKTKKEKSILCVSHVEKSSSFHRCMRRLFFSLL